MLCTHQTIPPNLLSLMSKNWSWSNPVSVPTWSRWFHSLGERTRCTQVHSTGIRRVFEFRLRSSSKIRARRPCLQIHVRCVSSDDQVSLHRDWICAVRGLRVRHWSAERKRPLERTDPLILSSSLWILVTRDPTGSPLRGGCHEVFQRIL